MAGTIAVKKWFFVIFPHFLKKHYQKCPRVQRCMMTFLQMNLFWVLWELGTTQFWWKTYFLLILCIFPCFSQFYSARVRTSWKSNEPFGHKNIMFWTFPNCRIQKRTFYFQKIQKQLIISENTECVSLRRFQCFNRKTPCAKSCYHARCFLFPSDAMNLNIEIPP